MFQVVLKGEHSDAYLPGALTAPRPMTTFFIFTSQILMIEFIGMI